MGQPRAGAPTDASTDASTPAGEESLLKRLWLDPYETTRKTAKRVKTLAQMLVGLVTVGFVIWVVFRDQLTIPHLDPGRSALEAAGSGLAVAAAIELAYTLFTDGPDEAINPLLLGLSAFGLIEVSNPHTRLTGSTAAALLLLALSLVVLFGLSRWFEAHQSDQGSGHRSGLAERDRSGGGG